VPTAPQVAEAALELEAALEFEAEPLLAAPQVAEALLELEAEPVADEPLELAVHEEKDSIHEV